MTLKWRRCDVTTSHRRHSTSCANQIFNKSVLNDYISHLKIWYYREFKNRIERNSFASTFKSNKSYIYNYFTLQLGTIVIFSCFTQKLKEMWVDYWGGPKGMLAPPLKLLGGGPAPPPPLAPPLPTPMINTNVALHFNFNNIRILSVDFDKNEIDRFCKETYWFINLTLCIQKARRMDSKLLYTI